MHNTFVSRFAGAFLLTTALTTVVPLVARGASFSANLEGQSRDISTPALANLPGGQGVGDKTWTGGGLANWREADWVPVRVSMSGNAVTGQPIVVQLDYASNVNPGEAGAFTYVCADRSATCNPATPKPNPTPANGQFTYPDTLRPDTITTSNPHDSTGTAKGFQITGGVTKLYSVAVSPNPIVPGTTNTITYTFNVDTDGTAGTVEFMVRLQAGSHNFGGASLQIKGSPALGTISVFKPAAAGGFPDLTTTKSGPSSAAPGQTITYTVNYSNIAAVASPSATPNTGTGVQVVDTLPAGMTYVAGSSTCAACIGGQEPAIISNTLTWDVNDLAAGAPNAAGSTGTITFKAKVDNAVALNTTLTNTARIYCAQNDANPANDSSTFNTTVALTGTTLTVGTASGTYGGTATLSATLTDTATSAVIAGQPVTFILNGNSVCGGTGQQSCPSTNASGVATLTNVYLTSNGLAGGTAIPVPPAVPGNYPSGVAASYAGTVVPPIHGSSTGSNSLSITPAALSITAKNASKTYGSTLTFAGTEFTTSGLVGTDSVSSVTLTSTGAVNTATVAGSPYAIVPSAAVAGSGTDFNNYTVSYTNGTLTVNKATLTGSNIAITPYNVVYDASSHTATGTVTGLLGEDLSNLLDLSGTTHTNAGTYSTDPWSFAGDSNYNSANGTVSDAITKADLPIGPPSGSPGITITGYNVVYDAGAHTATGTAKGFSGEDLSGLLDLTATTHTDAASYPTDAWSFAGNSNYNPRSGTVADNISKADLPISPAPGAPGITITGYTVTYDGNAHTAAGSAKGFLGEDLSGLLNLTGTTHTNAGSYPTDAWSFAGNSNYNSASGTVADAINKATLTPGGPGNGTINIVGYSVTYDGSSHTATGTATGVKGEDLSSLLNLTGTTHTNAGAYGTDPWSFAGNSNYNSSNGTVADNISKANLPIGPNGINITPYSVTYDGANHTATGTAKGFLNEDLSNLLDLSGTTHKAAATYANDPWSFAGNSNYNSANGTVSDQIGGKALHVTATGVNRVYDGTTAATVTLATDAVSGDVVTAAYTGATFADRNIGTGKAVSVTGISISGGAQAGNYTLANTTASTTANITKRPITVTAQPDSKVYDGTTTSTVSPKVTSGTIVAPDTGNFTQSFSGRAVGGTVTLTPSGSVTDGNNGANYAITFVPITGPGGAITARTVTPGITAASKTYDGNTSATIAARSLTGVLSGDTVTLTGGTATFSDPNAGTGKTVTAVSLALSGADAGNYALSSTSATATADIFKASQTINFGAIQNQVLNVDPPLIVSPTASSGLPVAVALKSGPATINGNTVTVTGLGKVTLTASQPGNNNYDAAASVDQTFNVVPPPALLNISTRGRVGTGDNVLIGGYIVKGIEPKTFAARGIGPSLKGTALPQTVLDPVVELHGPDGKTFMKNDNWQDTQASDIVNSGLAPTNVLEAAAIATTAPGNYTAIVSDKANANLPPGGTANIGIGLVELYDLSQNAAAVLANISTRGVAGTGDDVMIGGFIVNGKLGAAKVIMRAIGPSLAASGVANTLQDPTLELRDKNGALLASNDNWQDDATQAAAIQATTIPPGNPKEAAIVISLPPSNYTFIVQDKNGVSGVALAEVYDLTN